MKDTMQVFLHRMYSQNMHLSNINADYMNI